MAVEKIPITSRAQWLDLRKKFVTASDVPAICGVSGYDRTPLGVYLEKKELTLPPEENTAMRRGRWLEPAVFAAVEEQFPSWEIRRAKVFLADRENRLGATPDGAAIDPERRGLGIIQAKVISLPVFKAKWLDDPETREPADTAPAHVPIDYGLQTLTEAMLADDREPRSPREEEALWACVAALVIDTFGAFLRVFPVERHAAAESAIRKAVADWWVMADRNVMPAVNPTRDGAVLKALYPQDDGTEVDLSGDAEAQTLLDQRRLYKQTEKDAKTVLESVDTALKAKLGEHAYARTPDGSLISWKTSEVASYIVKARVQRTLRIKDPK